MHKHTNHLIHETSPYLLQHAHNPVNWFPWGEEALGQARAQDKPILVSIGYAACHWCHVMERESFEDETTAALMNERFINIKIDREERPDLDHIYMDAVQAMTGAGGWPLNVFLTPAGKPFYGGTYFPPVKAYNRASWTEVLEAVSSAYLERRHEIEAQAENLTEHLRTANSFGATAGPEAGAGLNRQHLDEAFANCMRSADTNWGGFGRAPKFPQSFTIQFLLRYHFVTGSREALDQALLSLDRMIEGGIYDQLGGGFARYSTDTEWLAPHFEKMLYDNALLISVLAEAYQLTQKPRYREVIVETMEFVLRELMDSREAAFYSALDADSEGEEGKYYVWSKAEVDVLLGDRAEEVCKYFDITEKGNWEGRNILRVRLQPAQFAAENGLAEDEWITVVTQAREQMFQARQKRPRPLLDDKVLLGWNALMNSACSRAYQVTGDRRYKDMAVSNMEFLLRGFKEGEAMLHTWKNGKAKYPAFLDDYAYLVQALIQLQEITGATHWLDEAGRITKFVIEEFGEADTGFFFFTKRDQPDVIVRKKEVYDGATPSGNAIMAYNLHQLGIIFDNNGWRERSHVMLEAVGILAVRYPTSFAIWVCLMQEVIVGTYEIAVLGADRCKLLRGLFGLYLPHRILMSSIAENQGFPLLAGKRGLEGSWIYLCKDFACQQPVDSIARFITLINRSKTLN